MKKIALLFLAMLLPMLASAATTTFQVGGISYETLENDPQAVMVISGNSKYSGDVVIPATVTYSGKTYIVKSIGQWAFWECTDLKSIVLPEGLVEIDNSSFSGCTGLKAITFPSSLKIIWGPAYSNQAGAFSGCTGLRSIYFPADMKTSQLYDVSIGNASFYGCTSLKTIYIAGSETLMGMYDVFGDCISVTDFVSCTQNPKLAYVDARSFQGFVETANLVVPDGKKTEYQESNEWYLFKHIFERSSYTKAFAVVTATQGGKVAYSSEDVAIGTQVWGITKGQSASFNITPADGHRLQKLLKDGQDVSSSVSNGKYTISNVQTDFTLEAFFVEGTEPQPQPQPTTQDKGTAKLSIEAFDIKAGETKTMLIDMLNPEDQVTMVQFDLHLPDGLSIATGDDAIDIAGRTTWKKHTLTSNTTNGITRLLLYSGTNDVIEGNSGAIISIKLVASSSFNGGDIKLENQLMTTPVLVESKPATYTYNIKGDSEPQNVPVEITCKVLNAMDGIVYYSTPYVKIACKNISDKDFEGKVWENFHKQLENGEWFKNWRGSGSRWPLKPGESLWRGTGYTLEDGVYMVEWGYEEDNGNIVSIGSTIIEVKSHECYRAIWMDYEIDNGIMKPFCDDDNLDFSHTEGLKAYIAIDYNASTCEVQMKQVSDAAAGTGLLLVGESGCYLAERTNSASTYSTNMLVGVLGEPLGHSRKIYPYDGDYTNYIYNQWYRTPIQKFILTWESGANMDNNEAYLRIPSQAAGDTQTITPVSDDPIFDGVQYVVSEDQPFDVYSLSGTMVKKGTRSLESLPKGVYIVNGRKFVKK